MPQALCRCGQSLPVPTGESERVVCPKCGARVRVRRKAEDPPSGDGFIRFFCPCGRRLKVPAEDPPKYGKCPDCARVVPVPADPVEAARHPGHPETPTDEFTPEQLAQVDSWTRDHLVRSANQDDAPSTHLHNPPLRVVADAPPSVPRNEVGLRVCPKCGRPVHLGAETCRDCGTPVPRR